MELYHGRRGSNVMCGMNRGRNQILLAMAVSMAFVLVWEAVPSARPGGGSLTPLLAGSDHAELELQSQSFESGPLSQNPLLEITEEGGGSTIYVGYGDHEELELRIPVIESGPLSQSPLLENTEKGAAGVDDEKSMGDDRSVNLGSHEAGPAAAPPQSVNDLPVVETEGNLFEETNADHESSSSRDVDETQTGNETDSRGNAFEAVETLVQRSNRATTSMQADDGDDKRKATTQDEEEKNLTDEAEHPSASTVSAEDEVEDSKLCDYSIGDWVLDTTRPLYSGKECAVWLSPDWACRRHHHPDKNMDRYRWQPRGCDLPAFNASAALETLRNKVVAFVGDSLGRQQYQSLLCMLTRGKNYSLTDVGSAFKFYTPKGARKPTGYAHRFDATNTTIVFRWTVTLARAQPMDDEDDNVALHLDRPEAFLEEHLGKVDVLVVNSGHHWNNDKMQLNGFQFHEHGEAVRERLGVSTAYKRTVHNVVRWLHENMRPGHNQVIYYRSLSPRHFRNGDWNTGGTCDRIRHEDGKQAQEGMWVDANAESAVAGTNVRLLNVTTLSFLRGESHVSKYGGRKFGQDCLHWCLPGVPDTWNEIMLAEIGGTFTPRSKNQTFMPIFKSH